MSLREKDVARLEQMFAADCQIAIDALAYHEMTDDQYIEFELCLNTFLKYDDLKEFVSKTLVGKTKNIVRCFKPENRLGGLWPSYHRLIRLIVKFCDKDSIDAFATYLLTNKLPSHFFVLIEELMRTNVDVTEYLKTFESLILVQQYSLEMINKYLSITGQDAWGLTKNLLKNSQYGSLINYIRALNADSTRLKVIGEQIVPSVIENYNPSVIENFGSRTHYLAITMAIAEGGFDFLHDLLHHSQHMGEVEKDFSLYLAVNQVHNVNAVKNFMHYLGMANPSAISAFEDKLLKDSRPHLLVQYATEVPNSNKRKVLVRLVEIKDETFIVEFIKKFPVFRSLMPML